MKGSLQGGREVEREGKGIKERRDGGTRAAERETVRDDGGRGIKRMHE